MAGQGTGVADPGHSAGAHLPRESQRSRSAAAALRSQRGRDPPRGGAAVVHGALRPRQPDHELPGAALPARAGRHHPACACRPPGRGARRLPRKGAGQDPARAALWRAHRARGAPALPVLWDRRRHTPVPHPPGRVPPLVGRRGARPHPGAGRPCRPRLDREQRGRRRRRVRRVRLPNQATGLVKLCWKDSWDAIQHADGTLARGRSRLAIRAMHTTHAALRASGPRGVGAIRRSPSASSARQPICASASTATSGCPSVAATPRAGRESAR